MRSCWFLFDQCAAGPWDWFSARSRPPGSPHDAVRQLAVLSATLRALEDISQPGTVVHLPFEWESREKLNIYPQEAPPIAKFLRRHPWYVPKFLNRTLPEVSD